MQASDKTINIVLLVDRIRNGTVLFQAVVRGCCSEDACSSKLTGSICSRVIKVRFLGFSFLDTYAGGIVPCVQFFFRSVSGGLRHYSRQRSNNQCLCMDYSFAWNYVSFVSRICVSKACVIDLTAVHRKYLS